MTFPPGLARGFIAAVLVSTLITVQFTQPSNAGGTLGKVLQTLVFAVVAFYFGSRQTKRPHDVGETGEAGAAAQAEGHSGEQQVTEQG